MRRKRLLWQLYPSYLLVTVLSLAAVVAYAWQMLPNSWIAHVEGSLEETALMLEATVRQPLIDGRRAELDQISKEYRNRTSLRIAVIRPDGEVVADSVRALRRVGSQAGLREVEDALEGRTGTARRYSDELRQEMLYVAVPIRQDNEVIGVLRIAKPMASITRELDAMQFRLAAGSVVVAAVFAGISLMICRRISRPLEEIRDGAERFAQGDLDHRLPVADSLEIGALADALNHMADELSDRIEALDSERNQRGAILASMVEGVLAVDADQRLISLNLAGARLLGIDQTRARGRHLLEVVRNPELQQVVSDVLSTQRTRVAEITMHDRFERTLEAQGTVLRAAQGQRIGALVVLHDITQLRRLENIRRDFVANVSHELKTPVTSIKGFVETLLDGALQETEDARRFLEIVSSQADRLNAIIEDLLMLSRVEQETEKAEIALESGPVRCVLEAAVSVCQMKAAKKGLELIVECDRSLHAKINAQLLEQAVVNLLDNAIKYSPPGKDVILRGERLNGRIALHVIDNGPGISGEHLARIFERFYRVDKARSRKLGGTGLGLAIAKHIAQAHGGHATVQSTPGKGSTFTIHVEACTSCEVAGAES